MAAAMRYLTTQLLCMILVLCVGSAAYAGAGARLTHAASRQGMVDIVICGAQGAQTVTLDASGRPVSPSKMRCDHCADCQLTAFAPLGAAANVADAFLRAPKVQSDARHLLPAQTLRMAEARAPPTAHSKEMAS